MNVDAVVEPVSRHFRTRRMREFSRLFRICGGDRIVDVGGRLANWTYISEEPHVVLLNVDADVWERGRFSKIRGDGRSLQYEDMYFDVAYSNSVIEHVGTWDQQKAFASEIRRVAPRYYIQTPYKHFPIEPHFLTPFVQYLSKSAAKKIIRRFTVFGWLARPNRAWIEDFVDQTRLLTKTEFKALFPDAIIREERFLGLTKSLIAMRL